MQTWSALSASTVSSAHCRLRTGPCCMAPGGMPCFPNQGQQMGTPPRMAAGSGLEVGDSQNTSRCPFGTQDSSCAPCSATIAVPWWVLSCRQAWLACAMVCMLDFAGMLKLSAVPLQKPVRTPSHFVRANHCRLEIQQPHRQGRRCRGPTTRSAGRPSFLRAPSGPAQWHPPG